MLSPPAVNPPSQSVSCSLFGHRYYVAQQFTDLGRRVCCHGCNADILIHDKLQTAAPWHPDTDDILRVSGIPVVQPLYKLVKRKLG